MARPRKPQICCSSRCGRDILPDEKAIALTCFAQTLGMGKQRTSKSERLFLCPQCAYRVAGVEKEPSQTAPFDRAIFKVLLDLVGAEPGDVAQAAWEQLKRRRIDVLYNGSPALPEGEILPPTKALKAAS